MARSAEFAWSSTEPFYWPGIDPRLLFFKKAGFAVLCMHGNGKFLDDKLLSGMCEALTLTKQYGQEVDAGLM